MTAEAAREECLPLVQAPGSSVFSRRSSQAAINLVERVRSVLASRDLTLHRVSQESETSYGRSSPYFIPHNLYYDLRLGTATPSIHQLVALSRISGYRLSDWLLVFGFDLEDIPRLQVLLPSTRTTLLNSSLTDPSAWVSWFDNKYAPPSQAPQVAPLTELLQVTHRRRLGSLSHLSNTGFLYARIGIEDALAFPELLPGSIVRANPAIGQEVIFRHNSPTPREIFLIQHSKGYFCCQIRVIGNDIVVPVSRELPYAQVELHLPREAQLLGVVDLEIRSLSSLEPPSVPNDLSKYWKPGVLTPERTLGELLRRTRRKLNLSLRQVSSLTRRIADLLGNEMYFVSQSSLSDYEASEVAPRHIHKALSLCALCGIAFSRFLAVIGIASNDAGVIPMPDYFVTRVFGPASLPASQEEQEIEPVGFLSQLLQQSKDVPFFLRESLPAICGLSDISLGNFFWIGGERTALNPYLENGLIAIVNRRKKKPIHFLSKPLWQQPVYALLKRDGTYFCACCGLENSTIVVHPYSAQFYRLPQLRYHQDVEVMGQLVTIVRKIRYVFD